VSSYIVGSEHIDALVRLALEGPEGTSPARWETSRPSWQRGPFPGGRTTEATPLQANAIGQMLLDANAAGAETQYPSRLRSRPRLRYQYPGAAASPNLTAVEALKAIQAFAYQSSDHPGWSRSEAARFCEALRDSLITCLPGWEDAPWALTSESLRTSRNTSRMRELANQLAGSTDPDALRLAVDYRGNGWTVRFVDTQDYGTLMTMALSSSAGGIGGDPVVSTMRQAAALRGVGPRPTAVIILRQGIGDRHRMIECTAGGFCGAQRTLSADDLRTMTGRTIAALVQPADALIRLLADTEPAHRHQRVLTRDFVPDELHT